MSDLPLWYVIIINTKEATKVAAKDERLSHLPSSPMTEEIGNQGDSEAAPVLIRLFCWTAIGSEVWSRHFSRAASSKEDSQIPHLSTAAAKEDAQMERAQHLGQYFHAAHVQR